MKCPNCGSLEVVDERDPEKKVIKAECLNCQHEWKQPYNPNSKAI